MPKPVDGYIEDRVAALEAAVEAMEYRVTTLVGQVATQEARIATLEDELAGFQSIDISAEGLSANITLKMAARVDP